MLKVTIVLIRTYPKTTGVTICDMGLPSEWDLKLFFYNLLYIIHMKHLFDLTTYRLSPCCNFL